MKSKCVACIVNVFVLVAVLVYPLAAARAALCEKCRDLMFTDSPGKCMVCGAPTSSAALKLCPKCSAKRHQCEHCLTRLSAKEEAAADSAPAAPMPPGSVSEELRAPAPASPAPAAPTTAGNGQGELSKNDDGAASVPPPAALPSPASPDLPPPAADRATLPGPASQTAPSPAAAPAKPRPIHPGKAGTYTSGKWRFQLQIADAGTRAEGRWGWLTYDGQKLPRGNVNDYYETPWGPMYWVDVPRSTLGMHGFMPVPSPQNPRPGRELTLPAGLASAGAATSPAVSSAPTAASAASKVQTLEINRSHNGQLARLRVGNVLIIRLPGHPASGYQWEVGTTNSRSMRLTVRPQYSPPSASAGTAAAGTYTFVYQAVQPGTGSIRLYYVRPGDPSHPRDMFAVGVNVAAATTPQSARSSARPPAQDSR